MRILHVIPFLWSGAGNVVTRLCEAQAVSSDVAIVTSGRSKGFTDWPEYRNQLQAAGVQHFQIDFFDRDPAVFWPSIDSFAKLTSVWTPDLVHCHSGVPACAAAATGARFIGQLHSWGVGRPGWMNSMDLRGYRAAERVLCSSAAYRKILVDGGVDPSRIRYLPWGLDLNEIRAKANPLPLGKGGAQRRVRAEGSANSSNFTFHIGFLGRIEPRKRQLDLARAFLQFHRRYPDSILEFIGPCADKAYGARVRAFISKHCLNRCVKLRGRIENPYPKLKSWDLFTSLSSDEGQGIAILEAMALGVPVLGRRVAGVEDYLHDRETGVAVASPAARAVAEEMEWAFHHRADLKRIAGHAMRMVETQYNWESTLQKMNSLYQSLAA